ncbi:MAG: 4Fe-4S dicluster domain-containing protein [Deltaproteobacteria bacterium]|nr:4Fe-4S dicluster domain-containing protein [Deltaproteobacteria bacterium]
MPRIAIDKDLCKKCGRCAKACVRTVFQQDEKGSSPRIENLSLCYACGECVAVCANGAISHSDYPEGTVTPILQEQLPSLEQTMELIHSRRSHRLFKNKAVEKEAIEQVIEAARFAPSGHNEQSTEFIVVEDQKVIREIAELTAGYIEKLVGNFSNPIGRTIVRFVLGRRGSKYVAGMVPELKHVVERFNTGTDWILRQPPVLLLFCADNAAGSFMRINATLAVQNATLAAEASGLGSYYTGFVILAAEQDDKLNKLLDLPATHQIYGGLAMGYPELKYKNWPERNPAKVKWL